jgi:flagellar assembly protein FliH
MSFRARRLAGPCAIEPFSWGDDQRARVAARPRSDAGNTGPDLVAVEREAFLKGYAQGEKAASEAAAAKADALVKRLVATIEEQAAHRAEVIRRSEQQTVHLVLAIARRLIDREIAADRGILVAMARSALARLADCATATIRLHPEDYAALAPETTTVASGSRITLVADAAVDRGGCLVDSEFGVMDVSPGAQVEELARVLLDTSARTGELHGVD